MTENRKQYLQNIIDRGGGVITLSGFLGIMVGPKEMNKKISAGWGFCDIETATVEILDELMETVPRQIQDFRANLEKKDKRGK